jgi:hypothetical protein
VAIVRLGSEAVDRRQMKPLLHRNAVAVMARQMDTADQISGKGCGIRGLHQRRLRIPRSDQVGSGVVAGPHVQDS